MIFPQNLEGISQVSSNSWAAVELFVTLLRGPSMKPSCLSGGLILSSFLAFGVVGVGEVSFIELGVWGPFSLKILNVHVWEIFLICFFDDFLPFP